MSERHETTVSEVVVERAKAQREARNDRWDTTPREDPDLRWVGDLGEMVFARWLEVHGLTFLAATGPQAGRPDFAVDGLGLALKCSPLRAGRTRALSTVEHAHRRHADLLVFATYDVGGRRWTLRGALPPANYIAAAEPRPAKPGGIPFLLLDFEHLWPPGFLLAFLQGEPVRA